MELATDLTVDDTMLRAFGREHGIRSLRLFGSAARNELRDDSDIDLLVEFEPDRTPDLLGIAKLELELQELLSRDVDLRTAGELNPHFRDDVVATARVLYDPARDTTVPYSEPRAARNAAGLRMATSPQRPRSSR
jgi:uncharacterized protein